MKDVVTVKDIITIVFAILSFISGGILVYWRENKKLFQEKIFEHKFNAYKEILEELGMYYEDVFNFIEFFQEYEKTEEDWIVDAQPYFVEYYGKAYALKRLYYKNLALLPENQLLALSNTLSMCVAHITHHHHIHTDIPHDSYSNLYNLIITFAEEARRDLSINILNVTLNSRLVEAFYPISLPKKSAKNVKNTSDEDN